MNNDMKSAFQKAGVHGGGGGGGQKKICSCGAEFVPKEPHHRVCGDCNRKMRYGSTPTPDGGAPPLSGDYLKNGYFDEKGLLREGIFKDEAKDVARFLSQMMSPTSFRAFYNKAKAIENKYKMAGDFDVIRPSLFAFERDVTYQVSRGVVPEAFRKFIVTNANLAQKGPKEFKGFMEHFLSVLAYFKDASASSR